LITRRKMITNTGLGLAGFVIGTGASAPACGVSKDQAVRYTDLVIDYLKDIRPQAVQLGATQMAGLIDSAIPTLEKLKDALDKADIPTAGNFFNTVTGIISQINNALGQLTESATRNRIMGVLTIVNITLHTVKLFVETDDPADMRVLSRTGGPSVSSAEVIRKAFDATRF
jgi:hypothetical protein